MKTFLNNKEIKDYEKIKEPFFTKGRYYEIVNDNGLFVNKILFNKKMLLTNIEDFDPERRLYTLTFDKIGKIRARQQNFEKYYLDEEESAFNLIFGGSR